MYVDAFYSKKGGDHEKIKVVERINGERIYKEFEPDFHFYISDHRGSCKTIYGDTVKKVSPKSITEKLKLVKSSSYNTKLWESDVDPVVRCLEQEYQRYAGTPPSLHVAFFDIETSFNQATGGWSQPSEAKNYITSISVYLQWSGTMLCLAIPPETLTKEEAEKIANEVGNVILFDKELDMLSAFMDVIEDADIVSGWNSAGYDIPYIVNRIKQVMGRHEARRLCLWGQEPKARSFEFGGKEVPTYDLIGRIHMDYMELYKKYNFEERHSYALNAISEIELQDHKVEYVGSLDELYNDDFKLFLEYNIHDTRLLDKLDRKLQFIDLSNAIAHANCVLIPTTMGVVAVTDQALLMEAHNKGLVAMNKKHSKDANESRAAGGWVATPKKGLHKWIGSTDMKSLYPSVIRAFNMSNETIVGQIRLDETNPQILAWLAKGGTKHTFAGWWNDKFNVLEMEYFYNGDISHKLTLDMEDGTSFTLTGAELRNLIFDNRRNWCISANGTIFRTDIGGLIPGLLTRWYTERKQLQKLQTNYESLADNDKMAGTKVPSSLFTDADIDDSVPISDPHSPNTAYNPKVLAGLVEAGVKSDVVNYMNAHKLFAKDGKAVHRFQNDLETYTRFWDKRQLVKKINLNAAYGALLNAGSRFFDQRLGQSTTLSGRTVTRHMASKTNEVLVGEYDHYGKAIIYGDTDSTYFSAWPMVRDEVLRGELEWTKESVVDLYNSIAEHVSDTFAPFLKEKLNVPIENVKGVVASSRETVSETGLFIVKKRYAILMYDKDGIRQDVGGKPGKVKAMGLDLKRADTPKFVQKFLSEILLDTLMDKGEEHVLKKIREFKTKFEDMKPWEKGTPRAVNKLSFYGKKEEEFFALQLSGRIPESLSIPGHVRASLNWNRMKELQCDQHAMRIMDGQKIVVCKLKETSLNSLVSIAFPIDEPHLPDWFLSLPFDDDTMMTGIVDKKVRNLLGVLKWDFSKTNKEHAHLETLFDFSSF